MDKWERKQRNIEARMSENSRIESLTEEQHNALESLCRIRHELHTNQEKMFNGNSDLEEYIDNGCGGNKISDILTEVGLNPIDFNIDFSELPCAEDYYIDDEPFSDFNEWNEQTGAFNTYNNAIEQCNKKIEEYLTQIDTEHGTHYCPTGLDRLKN